MDDGVAVIRTHVESATGMFNVTSILVMNSGVRGLLLVCACYYKALTVIYVILQQWCGKHVATGVAKDNANLQPVGADW